MQVNKPYMDPMGYYVSSSVTSHPIDTRVSGGAVKITKGGPPRPEFVAAPR